ncbi:GNAT family N-acetyltransferase [Halomicrobium salinisoli]|uniref:GNAT family N-acetyltransferase n=1 Tax=Halomicrobium salinisoli TaxID=2878391 RepID=UPI001CF010B7|nr:GNAT family N-acetyltransferase [Halomicrobium salinisoli]
MVQIREGVPDDESRITEVHVASVRGVDESAYTDDEFTVWESGAASISYALDDAATVFLVAEDDRSVAGFAEASVDKAELDKLYVAPSYQHQGIATSLSNEIDRRLRSHDVDSVYVEASVNAVPFYKRVGYEQVSTHQKSITHDGTSVEMTVVDMEKDLR